MLASTPLQPASMVTPKPLPGFQMVLPLAIVSVSKVRMMVALISATVLVTGMTR